MAKPTDPLLDLVYQVLDHAVESLKGTDGPLTPFAVIETADGKRTLTRFVETEDPEVAMREVRSLVEEVIDCVKYAVVSDGNLTEDGRQSPAVMVEAGEEGGPHGFAFVQRFASTEDCRYARPVHNPALVDQPYLLRPSSADYA
jgi:hypothetical protein